jgi:ADP-heptose:LPS heptosyltransferase
MASMYDRILHRNFSEFPGRFLFRSGLKGRKLFFFLRNFFGKMVHPGRGRTLQLSEHMRILIIRTDRIGDIVLSTPALRALRRRYPQAAIDYVVQKKYAAILNCFEGWNTVYPVDTADFRQLKALGKSLAHCRYDAVVVEHPAAYAYGLAGNAKGACTIGWNAKGYGYLLDIGFDDDRSVACRHQVENNLRLLAPLGVADPSPEFPVKETDQGRQEFEAFRSRYGIGDRDRVLAVHPGSYSPRVRWSPDKFAQLVDRACDYGLKPVLFGGESDREVIGQVLLSASGKPVVSIGELGLEGLISFLKNSAAFVGNSTGPMHIAASTGIWTIAVFGSRYPMDSLELWRPWGPKGVVVTAPGCRCKDCIPWICKDMECLSSITVDMVWVRVKAVLDGAAARSR